MFRALLVSVSLLAAAPAIADDLVSADLRIVLDADETTEQVVTDVGTFVELSEGNVLLVRPADDTEDSVDTWAADGTVLSKLILRNRDAGERVVLWEVSVVAEGEDANGNQFLSLSGSTSEPTLSWDVSKNPDV